MAIRQTCVVLVCCAVVLVAVRGGPAAHADQAGKGPFAAMAGDWSGRWSQDNGMGGRVSVRLYSAPKVGDLAGVLNYDGSCFTRLTRIEGPEAELWVREEVTRDHGGGCITGGKMLFSLGEDDKLRFRWWYPDGKEGAEGTLERRNKK